MLRIIVDLPFPPSVNRVWRAQPNRRSRSFATRAAVHRSEEYRAWIARADQLAITQRICTPRNRIRGAFTASLVLDRARSRIDLDNALKAVLDWSQRVELIANDNDCQELTARWGTAAEAPEGCRLLLCELLKEAVSA